MTPLQKEALNRSLEFLGDAEKEVFKDHDLSKALGNPTCTINKVLSAINKAGRIIKLAIEDSNK